MAEAGEIIIADPGSDKAILRVGTDKCAHCGRHFVRSPASGKIRGFCMNCKGPVCGPGCAECVPEEAMLEVMEGTRNPTAKSVGGNLWFPPGTGN